MTYARKPFLVVLLAALVLATPAQADYRYPGQRTAHDPTLDAMLAAADTYWDRLGVPLPCEITVLDVAETLAGDDVPGREPHGRGYSPLLGHDDCRIVLDSYYTGQQLALMRNVRRDRWERRLAAAGLCGGIAHEDGHTRGLPHGAGKYEVMREDAWRISRWEDLPHECRVVARHLVRAPKLGEPARAER